MRAAITIALAAGLGACLGPSQEQRAFVDHIEEAAEQSILASGATEAEARQVDVNKVVWLKGEHTAVVDAVFPRKGATARVHLPVSVRFEQGAEGWYVEEAVPDRASMDRLEAELGAAVIRSSETRKQQAVIDRRVQAAQAQFAFDVRSLFPDGHPPTLVRSDMNGCTGILTFTASWSGLSADARRARVRQVVEVLKRSHREINCGNPKVKVLVDDREVAGWNSKDGVFLR